MKLRKVTYVAEEEQGFQQAPNGAFCQRTSRKSERNYEVDANLVKNIDSTMNNLNQASVLLNQNLEALKHNIFFRGYFKKLEKEKQKAQKNQK